jgi:IclR family mhp operon transcriptional activator
MLAPHRGDIPLVTAHVRSASRALRLLVALNQRGQATLSELALDAQLSRPTALRMLRTLEAEGFVLRAPDPHHYQPTHRVRLLSHGFEDETWITQCARPHMLALGEKLVWPISIATIYGTRMRIRDNTDSTSPLAVRRLAAGLSLPLLESASGKVYLAWCSAAQRQTLLDLLERSSDPADRLARERAEVRRVLGDVRERGYALHHVKLQVAVSDLTTLSVPVFANKRIIAALTIRLSRSAVPDRVAVGRFLTPLRSTSAAITADFEQRGLRPPSPAGSS